MSAPVQQPGIAPNADDYISADFFRALRKCKEDDSMTGDLKLCEFVSGMMVDFANVVMRQKPELTVWEGAMPESNGKSNFTAILNRADAEGLDKFGGFTIARSEYPDRVRYEADCVRHLIGELAERPCITDYDADKHSGYVAPNAAYKATGSAK